MKKYYYEMTENEIKKSIKDFEKYLQSNDCIINNITGVKPLEYCYTSSSSLAGVFLPNNEIEIKEHAHFYDFCCIGINENHQTGLYLSLKPEYYENGSPKGFLSEYLFQPFEVISYKYFDIKNAIIKDIKELKEDIEILKSVKLETKKDGSTFKDYNKNFSYIYINQYNKQKYTYNINFVVDYNFKGYISSVDICFYGLKIYHYLKEADQNKYTNINEYKNPVAMYQLIIEILQEYKSRLQEKESILKDSLKLFKKAQKIKADYLKKKSEFYKLHYFNEFLKVESYETD